MNLLLKVTPHLSILVLWILFEGFPLQLIQMFEVGMLLLWIWSEIYEHSYSYVY